MEFGKRKIERSFYREDLVDLIKCTNFTEKKHKIKFWTFSHELNNFFLIQGKRNTDKRKKTEKTRMVSAHVANNLRKSEKILHNSVL